MKIKRLFIANRGEIAVRIIRACKKMNLVSIQGYSEADADSLAVSMADESICVGGAKSSDSYLNSEKILAAAKKTNADSIHPGYGFLAENADFAQSVEKEGLIFIGPGGDVIRKMGDKIAAIQIAGEAGVPVVPGSGKALESVEEALKFVENFPVVIKAAGGGGGRGIRVAKNEKEFKEFFSLAKAEALAAFGDGRLYAEAFVEDAHHVEVQILGDGKKAVHCFERQCSLQRRRQKVWEEAPCEMIPEEICEELRSAAVKIGEAISYRGAGTVEFLYDRKKEKFYFIEMNVRIQVEHPVTEMITGLDLIEEMILLAAGNPLRLKQNQIKKKGHSIEVRINAEDPENGFMPFPGEISEFSVPEGENVRMDTMLFPGYRIPPFYDSLLGKLIVRGENREKALDELKKALNELTIGGVKTTIPLFKILVDEADVRNGNFNVNWLENKLQNVF